MLILLYLSTLNPFVKNFRLKDQKDILNVKLLESNAQDLNKETLDILPSNFEEIIRKNNLILTHEDLVYLLNNGYVFLEEKAEKEDDDEQIKKENVYIDISSKYKELSHSNTQIYVSSQVLSHYFIDRFKEIKNSSLEYDSLRKSLKRKVFSLQTKIAFLGGRSFIEGKGIYSLPLFQKERLETIARYSDIEIIIENDIENYINIQKHIEKTSSSFPQFENLQKEVNAVIEYLNQEDSINEKLIIIEILEEIPPIQQKNSDKFKVGYLLKHTNNSLVLFPYITDDKDIISKIVDSNNFDTDYDITPSNQEVGTVRVPVLMYHHIAHVPQNSSDFKKGLYVDPEMFERQIAYLTRKNYRSISTNEFFSLLNSGVNPSQKTIVISFDDSLPTHYSVAFPILKKYRHTGVFFVPSEVGLLSKEQVKEISDNGMDIQSHSATHPILSRVSNRAILEKEIVESKNTLEQLTEKPINAFAYPGCVGNQIVFKRVLDSGYNLGFSCGRAIDHSLDNQTTLSRTQVYNEMEQFIRILSGTY